mgnify:CR=1 FL=1
MHRGRFLFRVVVHEPLLVGLTCWYGTLLAGLLGGYASVLAGRYEHEEAELAIYAFPILYLLAVVAAQQTLGWLWRATLAQHRLRYTWDEADLYTPEEDLL